MRDRYLSRFSDDVAKKQNIERHRRCDHVPWRRAGTFSAVPKQGDKTPSGQLLEQIDLPIGDKEPQSPAKCGEQNCDIERHLFRESGQHEMSPSENSNMNAQIMLHFASTLPARGKRDCRKRTPLAIARNTCVRDAAALKYA
jgi:hypothetical protein